MLKFVLFAITFVSSFSANAIVFSSTIGTVIDDSSGPAACTVTNTSFSKTEAVVVNLVNSAGTVLLNQVLSVGPQSYAISNMVSAPAGGVEFPRCIFGSRKAKNLRFSMVIFKPTGSAVEQTFEAR